MTQEINLGGTIYVSSKRAAEIVGYSQDYVGQLARSGAIDAQRVSGLWYVLEESIRAHKEKADDYVPQPPRRGDAKHSMDVSLSLDGKDYISAKRAAEITGYSQDYVGQLARSGSILSRQVGKRWYVDRTGLLAHKKEKDALLAAVQRDSVGLAKPEEETAQKEEAKEVTSDIRDTHFKYISDEKEDISAEANDESIQEIPIQKIFEDKEDLEEQSAVESDMEETNPISIRIVGEEKAPQVSEVLEEEAPFYYYEEEKPSHSPRKGLFALGATAIVLGVLTVGFYIISNSTSFGIPEFNIRKDDQITRDFGQNPFVASAREGITSLSNQFFSKELIYQRSQ